MNPPRTTAALVQAVLSEDYDVAGAPDLTPRITPASSIVDAVVSIGAKKFKGGYLGLALQDGGVDSPAELVERHLAAHFYCLSDKTYMARTTSGASGTFSGQTQMGLDFTPYGQAAKSIDTSGVLTALDKRQIATGAWLGKGVLNQISYWCRQGVG